MSTGNNHISITPVSKAVPFDNGTNGFTSTDTQSAIEEVQSHITSSASATTSFGRSGSFNTNTYLQCESVPSNIAGRTTLFTSATIVDAGFACDGVQTFNMKVQEHDGVTFTDLLTLSVTALNRGTFTFSPVSLTTGKELAIVISSGSTKNLVVSLVIKGTV